ncbi:MAG: hypothetical protein ACLFN5_06615 [bacterium]
MEFYVAVIAGCAVLTLLVLFLLTIRLWLACRQLEFFLTDMNLKVSPALEELRETAGKINETAEIIQHRVADTDRKFANIVGRFMNLSYDFLEKCNNVQEYFSLSKLKGLAILPAAYKLYQQFFKSTSYKKQTQEGENNG